MMHSRLTMHLLGVLLWVLSLHSGTFSSAVLPTTKMLTDLDKPEFYFPVSFDEIQPQFKMKITEKDLNKSANFASGLVDRLQRLEMNLASSDIHVKKGTPSQGQLIDSAPEAEALRQGRSSLIAVKATLQLMYTHCNKYNLNSKECVRFISNYDMLATPLRSACLSIRSSCTQEQTFSMYRSLDGSCNNMNDGLIGKAFTSYKRLLPASYSDGVQQIRRSVQRRFDLPSPRVISTSVFSHHDDLDKALTLVVMQWGQFIEHDMAHTAISKMVHSDGSIECCNTDGGFLAPRYIHPFCAPISIPSEDSFYSKYDVECMSYVRSIGVVKSDCSFGPLEQINQATHFLDASQIYGSDIHKLTQLRKFHGGLLKTNVIGRNHFLPISSRPTEDCQYSKPGAPCFISGDSRVNTQPHLAVMHTLWHREHNRIAVELAILNPDWDDEMLYQEARRIVTAEIEHITYNEWLPVLLGEKCVSKIQSSDVYSEALDAGVANSFANAALRALNSLVDDKLRLYTNNRKSNSSLHLQEHFNKPVVITEPGYFDGLIRGLSTQHSQKLDTNYVQDLTNHLYGNGKYGYDILSLDIQRGRDHGLPSYSAFRTLCGLPNIEDFTDLADVMDLPRIESLMSVYRNPHDIDLLVGAMSERPDGNSLFGPTFSCIVADQMLRTKRGDRYFYTSKSQPKPFSKEQLDEVQKVTLARVFCDNGDDIQMMQPNVFKEISESNQLVSCFSEDIAFMNLKLWSS